MTTELEAASAQTDKGANPEVTSAVSVSWAEEGRGLKVRLGRNSCFPKDLLSKPLAFLLSLPGREPNGTTVLTAPISVPVTALLVSFLASRLVHICLGLLAEKQC